MKTAFKTAMLAAVLATMTTGAVAQTFKGEVSGIIVSKSKPVPAEGAADVYTTPAAGFFILTQACGSTTLSLSGSTMGEFFKLQGACQTFTPGIVIPAGEILSCSNGSDSAASCLITGVLSKK